MPLHNTKFDAFLTNISILFSKVFVGPWKKRSLGLISLLIGFYISSSLTVYFLQKSGQRVFIVLVFVLFIELLTRLRLLELNQHQLLPLTFVDNIRIGMTYAIVLEAFKLGS